MGLDCSPDRLIVMFEMEIVLFEQSFKTSVPYYHNEVTDCWRSL